MDGRTASKTFKWDRYIGRDTTDKWYQDTMYVT